MLMVLGPHTARGNIPQAISHSVEFQAGMLRFMQQHDYTRVATRPDKVDEWTHIVIKAGEAERRQPQCRGPSRAPRPRLQRQPRAFPLHDRRSRERRLPGVRT